MKLSRLQILQGGSVMTFPHFPFLVSHITLHFHFLLLITCQCGHLSTFPFLHTTQSFGLWLIYAYSLFPLISCTILRPLTIVVGLSQALLVFNLSYVCLSSLRLDLLYQYQAIVSEAPYDWSSLLVNPLILRPIAWLHLNLYNLTWCQGSALVRHDRRDNHCVPLSFLKALLTEIWQWLRLVLGRNKAWCWWF